MSKNIAVVTGASSGIGKEFVRMLLNKSEIAQVWAIARRQDKLDALKAEFGERVRVFSVDLSVTDRILELGEQLKAEQPNILYLVNSAGYAKFCAYNELDVKTSVNMIDLNVSGVVAMGLICLPYMQNGARILNIASQSAFQPLPYLNIYSAAKAFVRNYTRALNVELKARGITATAVCPGWMKTDLIDNAQMGAEKTTNNFFGMVTADVVAKKALSDAEKGKDISVYSLYVKVAHVTAKLLPQRMMMKLWQWQQKM